MTVCHECFRKVVKREPNPRQDKAYSQLYFVEGTGRRNYDATPCINCGKQVGIFYTVLDK